MSRPSREYRSAGFPPMLVLVSASVLSLSLSLSFALASPRSAQAQAQGCPRVPTGLRCPLLPHDGGVRREALQALDAEGRRRVARGDLPGAAQAFGCLVEGDPTPESAGNLVVVLREQGELGDALLIARCAEDLAAPGSTRERARARREEIERRLGLPTPTPSGLAASAPALSAPASASAPASTIESRSLAPSAARRYRRWSYSALGLGVAALVAGGVVYAVARDRAHQFDDEQQRNGYSDRARTLRTDAQNLELGSWISAGIGVTAAAAGGLLLTF
jgi:hypothetical protein